MDHIHNKNKLFRRGNSGPLTYSGSIEQKIKKDGVVVVIQENKNLRAAIEIAIKDPDYYKSKRKKIRDELFSFNDGKCGERAAVAIKEFISSKETPERPLFYQLISMKKPVNEEVTIRREDMLAIIQKTLPIKNKFYSVEINFQFGCYINSRLALRNNTKHIYIRKLKVNEFLQNSEVRKKMLIALSEESIKIGAVSLSLKISKPRALLDFVDVFHENNLMFYDTDTNKKMNITYKELLKQDQFHCTVVASLKNNFEKKGLRFSA
jgi:hypothetical protein